MRFIIYFFCLFFLISLNVSAKITKKDYFSIFSKYQVTEKKKVQQVVNDCINKFGREKLKIIKTNDGDILEHKNEKEFLLNNEIKISTDGFRNNEKKFIFE